MSCSYPPIDLVQFEPLEFAGLSWEAYKPPIYIAAPFTDADKMPELAEKVEALGYTIPRKWWEEESIPEEQRTPEFLQRVAYADLIGVENADVVLLINSAISEGKAVEQGIALTLGTPIIAVGKRGEHSHNVFHYASEYTWVPTIEDALSLLKERI